MTAAPRVVVIGAGLSGLTAAYRLLQGGVDVFVLEARDRVGGRAWRIPVGSAWFDAGCELLDAEHHALLRLASELGVETAGGRPWVEEPGSDLDGAELDLYHELEAEIAALAGLLDPEHPEQLEGAAELDRETIAGWLAGRGASSRVLEAAETWIAVVSSSVPTTEMSLFAYAAKIAAGAAPTGLSRSGSSGVRPPSPGGSRTSWAAACASDRPLSAWRTAATRSRCGSPTAGPSAPCWPSWRCP